MVSSMVSIWVSMQKKTIVKQCLGFAVIAGLSSGVHAVERYVNIGVNSHDVSFSTGDAAVDASSQQDSGFHLGFGFRNQYGKSQKHYFGFGVEADELLGDVVLGLRALDYQYQIHDKFRIGAYFGGAQLDSGAAQTGYYTGLNLSYLNVIKNLDVVLDYRVTDDLARDRLFDDDPQDPLMRTNDIFLEYTVFAAYFNWRF
ncbi:MAG: hypothetical protein COA42_19825 [Alteromonadaceae bacterium]|nr:MAG: hypothetical protein COA42_19825 [Alteromonadaceae bacterium]